MDQVFFDAPFRSEQSTFKKCNKEITSGRINVTKVQKLVRDTLLRGYDIYPIQGGYVWLCVAMGGYLWLSVAICGYVRLYVATCSYVWLLVAMCGYMQLYVAIRGYVQLCAARSAYVWLWVAM